MSQAQEKKKKMSWLKSEKHSSHDLKTDSWWSMQTAASVKATRLCSIWSTLSSHFLTRTLILQKGNKSETCKRHCCFSLCPSLYSCRHGREQTGDKWRHSIFKSRQDKVSLLSNVCTVHTWYMAFLSLSLV